jgi:hypothetical protein
VPWTLSGTGGPTRATPRVGACASLGVAFLLCACGAATTARAFTPSAASATAPSSATPQPTAAVTPGPTSPTTSAQTLKLGASGFTAGASFNPLAIQLVTNVSTEEAINVIVTMTALNVGGTVLDKEQGYADVVRSGQTVGVIVNFVEDPSGVTAVKTMSATATWVPDANPSAVLTATGATLTPDGQGGAYVAGTVSSNYATALANVSVAAVCYSATGAVVGIAEDSVTSVPARGSAPFRAVGNLNAAVPAHCAAWAYPGAGP